MKNILLVLVGMMLLASCSTPRYAYYFDHYDYNSGRKAKVNENLAKTTRDVEISPLIIDESAMVASTESSVQPVTEAAPLAGQKSILSKKYSALSKEEKKEFRKEVKTIIKEYKKAKKSGDSEKATQAMDYNLKMAIIFGAVALTLSFFGGVNSIFWILSVVALVVGVVFFIKWIAEQ